MKTCYRVEVEQEEGGRFLAEVVDSPGVLAYGETAELALAHAQAPALRVLRTLSALGPPLIRFTRTACWMTVVFAKAGQAQSLWCGRDIESPGSAVDVVLIDVTAGRPRAIQLIH